MYKTFKVPVILGTTITVVLGYIIFLAVKIEPTFSNAVLLWLASVGILFVLRLATIAQKKSEKAGERAGARLAAKLFKVNPAEKHTEEPPDNEDPTFFQEACDLMFVGEYVALFFTFLPTIALVVIFNRAPGQEAMRPWEIIVLAPVTLFWLKYLEEHGRVKLCTPHIPIPIKWLVIPVAVIGLVSI